MLSRRLKPAFLSYFSPSINYTNMRCPLSSLPMRKQVIDGERLKFNILSSQIPEQVFKLTDSNIDNLTNNELLLAINKISRMQSEGEEKQKVYSAEHETSCKRLVTTLKGKKYI